ncbi:hypothetical protein C1M55_06450 [Rhodococcus qingshengii]|jgi:hypothetical protein|nr:hypothetical protein C1M55_06450 [Rhodococcus qingshengii]EME25277.1 hypothetical protein G418_01536 [Rhodococcus qingshengii BKS 20-40]QEM28657.1 hypothetical protein D6M20_18670 [Rhodococcus qingshengii]REK80607.1 hypothetical protein DVG80_14430 [Rhodococcus erythropolis]SCC58782.1 hypothetical protein GA0061093_113188 [Rhodococcus qingshengii]
MNCETHHLWCGRTESSSFIFASFGYSRFMDTHSDRQIPVHIRPEGVTDDEVKAAGVLSNALETVERARGALYDFHQLIGHADLMLDEVVELLRSSGNDDLADQVEGELMGRNVVEGRWTFQLVEEFDENYWSFFRECEKVVRDKLAGGVPHLFEAEMKERRRTHGLRHHEARP